MEEIDDLAHIKLAINFADLVRTTLGPRGMNKGIVKGANTIFTNDGSTIINALPSNNPIIELFKNLAKSQEEAIGDGTTTATIIAGQLLNNALQLINKGIHPTLIINGYNIAKVEAMKFLDENKEPGDKDKIIKTAFGTKISPNVIEHFKKLLKNVKDYENLKIHKINNQDPLLSELFKGYVFEGFTLNDRMKKKVEGKIVVLDYKTHVEAGNFNISQVDELKKINQYDREYKKEIVDKLVEKKIACIFYTDTSPEFESYLTEKEITGIVVYKRDDLDGICKALNLMATSDINNIFETEGKIKYVKPKRIYISGENETLIINGPTAQTLDEIERAVMDVVSLLKHEIDMVVGAGAIEIELAAHLEEVAKKVGGKEQLAINGFAEAIESIPLIIAENSGLDAIQILTGLKAIHQNDKNQGVDIVKGISDARERGIFDPVLVKIHAISSATDVSTLILKTDKLLKGEE